MIGGTTGPTDHSFDRTACQLHTDSKYRSRLDIRPHHPTMLPVALKTDQNSATFDDVLSFIERLTLKLGRIKTIQFHVHTIGYMWERHGMAWRQSAFSRSPRQLPHAARDQPGRVEKDTL